MDMVAPLRLVIDDSAVTSVDQTVPILDWSWRDEDPPASHSAEMVTRVSEAMLQLAETLSAGSFESAIVGDSVPVDTGSVPPKLPVAEGRISLPTVSETESSTAQAEASGTAAFVAHPCEHVVVGKHEGVRASLVFQSRGSSGEPSARAAMRALSARLATLEGSSRKKRASEFASNVLDQAVDGTFCGCKWVLARSRAEASLPSPKASAGSTIAAGAKATAGEVPSTVQASLPLSGGHSSAGQLPGGIDTQTPRGGGGRGAGEDSGAEGGRVPAVTTTRSIGSAGTGSEVPESGGPLTGGMDGEGGAATMRVDGRSTFTFEDEQDQEGHRGGQGEAGSAGNRVE